MEVCTNCTTLSSSSSGEVIRLLNSVAKNSATSSLKKADCRAEDDPPAPPSQDHKLSHITQLVSTEKQGQLQNS